jgi:glycerol-3-phosphate dehydrogenase
MGVTAPHLVRPLPFCVPRVAGTDVAAVAGLGGVLGDAVRTSVRGGRGSLPRARRVSADEVAAWLPAVRRRAGGGSGGVAFWDGQLTDDARLVVALARTAAGHGASVLTGATVAAVDGRSGVAGRGGAVVHVDVEGRRVEVQAGVVVNAAGVWSAGLAADVRLAPSRGSHLVLRAERLGHPTAALTVPLPGSRSRYVFALPQDTGLVLLGITDEPVEGPVPDADPQPSAAEVEQLLGTVNRVLAEPLTTADVVGAHAGLRPLVLPASAGAGPGDATADLSRTHLLHRSGAVLTVVGGKLTTYRAMAEQTVDAAVALLDRGARRSVTARLPLVGAAPRRVLDAVEAPARLVARYGTEAPRVQALGAEPVAEGRSETVGELRFAVRSEGARTVADLLDRRTRIGLVPADRAGAEATAEAVLAAEAPPAG